MSLNRQCLILCNSFNSKQSMELCISSSSTLFNPNPSRILHPSLTKHSIFLKNTSFHVKNTLLKPQQVCFFPLKTDQCQSVSCNAPSFVTRASSSSSVAVDDELERLPADIEVTEAEEPSSRVSF